MLEEEIAVSASTADYRDLGGRQEEDDQQPACYSPHLSNSTTSLAYYRALYDYLDLSNFASSKRIGSVEVVSAGSIPADALLAPLGPQTDLALLHISSIFTFTAPITDEETGESILNDQNEGGGPDRYSTAVGILLATHHFNNGDGSVVKEIQDIHQRCPIRFVADFYDAEASKRTAVDALVRQVLESPARPPSAIFGAVYSSVSIPLAAISSVYEIPQISARSTSTDLDDVDRFPNFSRLLPSDAGTARALVDLLKSRSPDKLRFMGVLYSNDPFGIAYHLAIKQWAELADDIDEEDRIIVRGVPFSNPDDIDLAVQNLAETGYRVFFGVVYSSHYEQVMRAAVKYGICGPGYVWIHSDGLPLTLLKGKSYEEGSPLAIATQGVGILQAEGGRETKDGMTGFDRYSDAWYRQTNDMTDYYNCVYRPKTNSMDDPSVYYQAEKDAFKNHELPPVAGGVFNYDAVIAMGLAACGILQEEGRNASLYFNGPELLDAFVKQEFEGASGFVKVDPTTHSRAPDTGFFVLHNVNGKTKDGKTTFVPDAVSYTTANPDVNSTAIHWVDFEGKQFIYSDGSTNFPLSLPPVVNFDQNHLSSGVRAVGLLLAGVIFACSIFFSGWTFWYREKRVVRASQPIFLQMICFGTLLMGATIVTLSIDDNVASQRGCDTACMLNPWFLATGFAIAFSSLFAKERRINKIFHNPHLKRMKVTAKDVMPPIAVLLGLNVMVLALWTGIAPLTWQRSNTGELDRYDRSVESIGKCTGESSKDWVPYSATILSINFVMVARANYQAFQARHIDTEFSESKWIAIIMASALQSLFIGLPLVIIVSEDPTASFIVKSGIIFVICMSFLLVMFVPKMFYLRDAYIEAAKKEQRKQAREARMASFFKRTHEPDPDDIEITIQTDERNNASARVLFHPEVEKEKIRSLESELDRAKASEKSMRQLLIKTSPRLSEMEDPEDQNVESFVENVSDHRVSFEPRGQQHRLSEISDLGGLHDDEGDSGLP